MKSYVFILAVIFCLYEVSQTQQAITFPERLQDQTFRSCRDPDGRWGWCTRWSLCDASQNRSSAEICGFVGREPVICCLYPEGVDPTQCSIPDGRPGTCKPKSDCKEDYFGWSDGTYCSESLGQCCPDIGNSVEKSVKQLCAAGRGSSSDYYFPTCGDSSIWGKSIIQQVIQGNVNQRAEELVKQNSTLYNVTSSRGLIKSFNYIEGDVSKRVHYVKEVGDHLCFVLVRGIAASYSLTKYMALLGERNNVTGEIDWFCDGVIINYDWVLTAAHCPNSRNVDIVRLGEYSYETDEDKVVPQDYEVDEIVFHPGYQFPAVYHDLALIKLNETIAYHPGVTPICLPWDYEKDIDAGATIFTVAGWGATQFLGENSPVLRQADLALDDVEKCSTNYAKLPFYSTRWPQGMSENDTMCASDPLKAGQDACQGDSGGPLVYIYRDAFVLGGIVSSGFGCGHPDFPGVYVPVHKKHYLEWINQTAFKDPCPSRTYYERTMTCF